MKKPTIKLSPNLGYLPPDKRSYWGYKLDVKLISYNELKNKDNPTATERYMLANELSGREHYDFIISLDNKNKELGRFTRRQIMEILNDMGFNVSSRLSGTYPSDFSAVMNVKGFILPGWNLFADLFSPKLEKLLLTKFAPGKERLHIRVYENNDGTWLITAHTDYNWLNINLYHTYKAHILHGAGDCRLGTALMVTLLNIFQEHLDKNQNLSTESIITTVKALYRNGVDEFYNKLLLTG